MAILSIQSHVVYGHAGNSAAVFPLQRLGRRVWAVNTVEFSNHTGYGAWKGRALDHELTEELVEGLGERGVLGEVSAVLSGYMGTAGVGQSVLGALQKVRAENPSALYCCDPVMGDVGRGFYVKAGIPEMFKEEVVKHADIITPNQFELEALTGIAADTIEGAGKAVAELHRRGPKIVLVTSFKPKDEASVETATPHIAMLVSDGAAVYLTSTPEFPFPSGMAGSGDLTTALFLARYLETRDIKQTLEMTTSSVYGIMEATYEAGSKELKIIEAQEELVNPKHRFKADIFEKFEKG